MSNQARQSISDFPFQPPPPPLPKKSLPALPIFISHVTRNKQLFLLNDLSPLYLLLFRDSSAKSPATSDDLFSSDDERDLPSNAPPKSSCKSPAMSEDMFSSDYEKDLPSSNGSIYIPESDLSSGSDSVVSASYDSDSDCKSEYPALQNATVSNSQPDEDVCSQTEQPALQYATVSKSQPEEGVCGKTEQSKPTIQSRGEGKYKWDKKHCCKFCGK